MTRSTFYILCYDTESNKYYARPEKGYKFCYDGYLFGVAKCGRQWLISELYTGLSTNIYINRLKDALPALEARYEGMKTVIEKCYKDHSDYIEIISAAYENAA